MRASNPDSGQPTQARLAGQFRGYDSERIYLSFPGRPVPDTIRWEYIDDLRVSTGHLTGLGVLRGMGVGLVVGVATFVVGYQVIDGYGPIVLLQVPLATVPVGGLLGLIWPPEAWAPVERPE